VTLNEFQKYPVQSSTNYSTNYNNLIPTLISGGYLQSTPTDPRNVSPYVYNYFSPSGGSRYSLWAVVELDRSKTCSTTGVSPQRRFMIKIGEPSNNCTP